MPTESSGVMISRRSRSGDFLFFAIAELVVEGCRSLLPPRGRSRRLLFTRSRLRKEDRMFTRVITVVILALGAVLAPAGAQQAAKVPRVGFLAPQGRSLP